MSLDITVTGETYCQTCCFCWRNNMSSSS